MSNIDLETGDDLRETVARPAAPRGRSAIGVAVLAGAGALIGWLWLRHPVANKPDETTEPFATARSTGPLPFPVEPQKTDNRLALPPPPIIAPPAPTLLPATPPTLVDDSEARRLAEEERLRKELEARKLAALRSTMLIYDAGAAGPAEAGSGLLGGGGATARVLGPEEDANRRFAASVSAQDVDIARASRIARTDALVPQGVMIRGSLETAIQSDLPGMVRAVTAEDVYSFDGRRVLIPKGTMLTGEYRSTLTRGQTRVLVIWTRMLRSDGVSVALGSYGTDALGRSGLPGDVDNHYFQRFGSAILLSVIGGGATYLGGLTPNGGQTAAAGVGTSYNQQSQTQAQQTIAQTFADLANQALKDSISIPPTIHVDQGARIIVFVKRDLDFSALYDDPVKEALHELRRSAAAKRGR